MPDTKFGWTNFYMEFADKLIAYQDNRGPLVATVHEICTSLGYTYLQKDQFYDGSSGPIQDICPFTTMGTFNRGITDTKRLGIAADLGRFLGVTEPAPDSFDSIPLLNNQQSWFFRWAKERGDDDIEALWRVFADAIELADSGSERARRSFEHSYGVALELPLVARNLTMGLYWIRPHKYPTLDGNSARYITDNIGITFPNPLPRQGREYLELADSLKERFTETDSHVHSFQELSLAAYEPPTSSPISTVWLVRAGSNGEDDNADLEHGIKTLGWGEVPDLTGAVDKDAVRERVQQGYPNASNQQIGSRTAKIFSFVQDIQEGNIVVLPLKTRPGQVALGRITGPYAYQEVEGVQRHTRPANWIRKDVPRSDFGQDLQESLNLPGTVNRIHGNEAERRIKAMLDGSRDPNIDTTEVETDEPIQPPLESAEAPPYTLQDISDEGCFLEQSKLETILNRLNVKKNLILQGPPGTGKTWLAKKLAFALIGEKDERCVRRIQFHPNLSYEDFIRGYRPDGDGKLTLVNGPLLKTINDARLDHASDYVMVIEEINRGNPAQIFGEMLTLLEADKRNSDEALKLAHSTSDAEKIYIPPNMYVIGTMNVADRSIALVDLALRRRFAFIDLEPVFDDVWRKWVHEQCGVPRDFLTTIEERMMALNDQIAADPSLGPQFRIGHSYVTPTPGTQIDNPTEWFRDVVDTEIGPLLDEYWFDNVSEAENAKSELLSEL